MDGCMHGWMDRCSPKGLNVLVDVLGGETCQDVTVYCAMNITWSKVSQDGPFKYSVISDRNNHEAEDASKHLLSDCHVSNGIRYA